MRKIKSFISVLLSLIIVSVFATSLVSSATTPASKTIGTVMHPQIESYYCGVASLQSVLINENSRSSKTPIVKASYLGIISNQRTIASFIKGYWGYDVDQYHQTPWYTYGNPSDGNTNPPCKTLNALTDNNWDIAGRNTGKGDFTIPNIQKYIMNSINKGHCVMANGQTGYYNNKGQFVRNITYNAYIGSKKVTYPNTTGHWVVVKGYENSGKTLIIVDPAANSSALNSSWKVLTNSTYKVNINEFYDFIGNGSHGIVYHK